jgi:hypothetical protein
VLFIFSKPEVFVLRKTKVTQDSPSSLAHLQRGGIVLSRPSPRTPRLFSAISAILGSALAAAAPVAKMLK